MPAIEDLRPFDSCVTLGRVVHSAYPQYLPTAESVLEMMDRYGIAEALVHDHHARLVYPQEAGNRRLLPIVRGIPRLHPVWVLEPSRQPGRKKAEALVNSMLEAGVRAARLRMKMIPPLPWLWADLCGALEAHRVPCFVDFGDVATKGAPSTGEVDGLRGICAAHPQLPLILSHVMGGLGVHPGLLVLIRQAGNLHLDIAGILEYWLEVATEVGPDRVLFATGAPFTDPGILISNVQYARGLDAQAKAMIYGDNLRRLMKGVR
jgi:predicted TIM-barrel fold metal-dependent hydrolase